MKHSNSATFHSLILKRMIKLILLFLCVIIKVNTIVSSVFLSPVINENHLEHIRKRKESKQTHTSFQEIKSESLGGEQV